jgi:hypothetical protein
MPGINDIDDIYRGDPWERTVEITVQADPENPDPDIDDDDDWEPVDLSGSQLAAQIRRSTADTSAVIEEVTVTTVTDGTDGLLLLELDAEQTAGLPDVCVWDLEQVGVRTHLAGKVRPTGQVTRQEDA